VVDLTTDTEGHNGDDRHDNCHQYENIKPESQAGVNSKVVVKIVEGNGMNCILGCIDDPKCSKSSRMLRIKISAPHRKISTPYRVPADTEKNELVIQVLLNDAYLVMAITMNESEWTSEATLSREPVSIKHICMV
jgi:hypothetical protein